MYTFDVEDVINLLFLNSNHLTKNYQYIGIAYENWTNNKMVFKVFNAQIKSLSTKSKTYNKPELKYLGKLANSMKYNDIKQNIDNYELSDIDMYFIGDLMAARVLYKIYQTCKTVNKYMTQGLTYNNYQIVYLPPFLADHYNFEPKYTGTKQSVETSHLINIFKKHKKDLFEVYFKYFSNVDFKKIRNVNNDLSEKATNNAYSQVQAGTSSLVNINAVNNNGMLTLKFNVSGSASLDDMYALLLGKNNVPNTSLEMCDLSEINLGVLYDQKFINPDPESFTDPLSNKKYYYLKPGTEYTIDMNKSKKILNIDADADISNNFNIGIMNISDQNIFHLYPTKANCTLSSDTQETCCFKFNKSVGKYTGLTGAFNNYTMYCTITQDPVKYIWNIYDPSGTTIYKCDITDTYSHNSNKYISLLPPIGPTGKNKWEILNNTFKIIDVKIDSTNNSIIVDYTISGGLFPTCT